MTELGIARARLRVAQEWLAGVRCLLPAGGSAQVSEQRVLDRLSRLWDAQQRAEPQPGCVTVTFP